MSDDTAEKVMTLAASLAGHGVDNESGGHCGSFVMVKPEQRDEIVSALRSAAAEIERLREVRDAAQYVLNAFKQDEADGYHTKDRQFAIEILEKAIGGLMPYDRDRAVAAEARLADAVKALREIAAMDPKSVRADDLGRAARIAGRAARIAAEGA